MIATRNPLNVWRQIGYNTGLRGGEIAPPRPAEARPSEIAAARSEYMRGYRLGVQARANRA